MRPGCASTGLRDALGAPSLTESCLPEPTRTHDFVGSPSPTMMYRVSGLGTYKQVGPGWFR